MAYFDQGTKQWPSYESGKIHSLLFVDFDSIYLSLRKKNDEAARWLGASPIKWLRAIESGELITWKWAIPPTAKAERFFKECVVYGVAKTWRKPNSTEIDRSTYLYSRYALSNVGCWLQSESDIGDGLARRIITRITMDVCRSLDGRREFNECMFLSASDNVQDLVYLANFRGIPSIVYVNETTELTYGNRVDGVIRESDLIRVLTRSADPNVKEYPPEIDPKRATKPWWIS